MTKRAPVYMPMEEWPEVDRTAWQDLFREGDILDGQGEAIHWAAATRASNAQHYGRWLGWLAASGQLADDIEPWQRVTPDQVHAYCRSLIGQLAPRTVASTIIGLKCVCKRMRPDGNWRWLMDLTNRLDAWAEPSVDRRPQILPVQQIFGGALHDLERLGPQAVQPRDRIAFRDALIVAVLAACPMRLRNLTAMRIGQNLHRSGADWRLSFEAAETKTRQSLRYLIPTSLAPWLAVYLAEIRPHLLGDRECDALWVSAVGTPLAYETHYMRITKLTKRLFGVAINPHIFRSIAATSLAESSPEDALSARPLLGHRLPDTTEHYYIKANRLVSSQRINAILIAVRGAEPPRKEP